MDRISPRRAERIKRSLAQSTSITAIWTWFSWPPKPLSRSWWPLFLCVSEALPLVHFPPQDDVVVFLAQFVALDIGGPTSLNKLADQAKHEGNDEGASQVKRLSVELVVVMLVGTSQVVFFGGRFIRAANSQSAHYDTVVNTSPPTTRT